MRSARPGVVAVPCWLGNEGGGSSRDLGSSGALSSDRGCRTKAHRLWFLQPSSCCARRGRGSRPRQRPRRRDASDREPADDRAVPGCCCSATAEPTSGRRSGGRPRWSSSNHRHRPGLCATASRESGSDAFRGNQPAGLQLIRAEPVGERAVGEVGDAKESSERGERCRVEFGPLPPPLPDDPVQMVLGM